MHWFGELLVFYLIGLVVVSLWLSIHFIPKWKAEKKVAELRYAQLESYRNCFRRMFDANSNAIAELESQLYGIFPDDVRQEMMSAHEEASKVINK